MGDLDLSAGRFKKRRIGLTAGPLAYGNLLQSGNHPTRQETNQEQEDIPGNRKESKKQNVREKQEEENGNTSDAINGPPIDSSDEEFAWDEAEDLNDISASEPSTPRVSFPSDHISRRAAELRVQQSNIPSTVFTQGGKPGHLEPNKSSRDNALEGDKLSNDETFFKAFVAPPRRLKAIYTKRPSLSNIHTPSSSPSKAKTSTAAARKSPRGKEASKAFRAANTDSVISQVDRIARKRTRERFVVPPVAPKDTSKAIDTQPTASWKRPKTLTVPNAIVVNNVSDNSGDEKVAFNLRRKFIKPLTYHVSSQLKSADVASVSSSSLSSPVSDEELELFSQEIISLSPEKSKYSQISPKTKCPICKEPVDRSFLGKFDNGTRLNMRQQTRLCRAHKASSAEAEWYEKGYPKIDWQCFEERLARFHPKLEDIIDGKKYSYYHEAFRKHLETGQGRTLQQRMLSKAGAEGLETGYYGSKGAKVMMENIMFHFATTIRNLATSNKLISSGGVSGYIQAVLIPELATMLIMEDMKINEEEARATLRASVEIGNLLNEEEDELITNEDLNLAENTQL